MSPSCPPSAPRVIPRQDTHPGLLRPLHQPPAACLPPSHWLHPVLLWPENSRPTTHLSLSQPFPCPQFQAQNPTLAGRPVLFMASPLQTLPPVSPPCPPPLCLSSPYLAQWAPRPCKPSPSCTWAGAAGSGFPSRDFTCDAQAGATSFRGPVAQAACSLGPGHSPPSPHEDVLCGSHSRWEVADVL